MAVTKIHPIKTTLKKAIDYIYNEEKTDGEVYVTTHLCSRENAYREFEMTRQQFHSKAKTLAHHLIQSFAPGEVSFEEAHQVGKELCDKILGDKYEYVLATHMIRNMFIITLFLIPSMKRKEKYITPTTALTGISEIRVTGYAGNIICL